MKIVYEFEASDISEAINDFCVKHKVTTKFTVTAKASGEFVVNMNSVEAPKDAAIPAPAVAPVVPTPPAPQPNPSSAQSIFVSKQPQQNVFGKPLTVADAAKE